MSLLNLPNELTFRIAWFILYCPTCHCHHVSRHLSSLARANRQLHAVLTPEILRTASTLQILVWAISHSRQDTITLAVNHGADLNILLLETRSIAQNSSNFHLGTHVEIASRMRISSTSATSHKLKLNALMVLLQAGGKLTIDSLTIATRRGDLDLLERCIPYITDIDERHERDGKTLLEVAGACGHIQVVGLLLAAGAAVNSTGGPGSPGYYPPLWTICGAPVPVLQILLDAGADAGWEHDGMSIVTHLQLTSGTWPDISGSIDLLARYGSQLRKGEEAIALWQAPVWESWTAGESAEVVKRVLQTERMKMPKEYRGWVPTVGGRSHSWGRKAVRGGLNEGCMCPQCPLEKTGGYRAVRALVQ